MSTLLVRYGVSRRRPGSRSKRDIETKRGELRLRGGVWLDSDTSDKIRARIRKAHPGWGIMGYAYVSGPTDEHVLRSNPAGDVLYRKRLGGGAEIEVRKGDDGLFHEYHYTNHPMSLGWSWYDSYPTLAAATAAVDRHIASFWGRSRCPPTPEETP